MCDKNDKPYKQDSVDNKSELIKNELYQDVHAKYLPLKG